MNAITPVAPQRLSILQAVANRYGMEPDTFEKTLLATVVPDKITKEQFWACLVVANEYRLNPLTKEIYFFPARGGGVVPMVGVDGWARIINDHPGFDGMEFDTSFRDEKPYSVTCKMFRKDRVRPIAVTEFYSECFRSTDPWKTAPARMLRHKAMIQAARYAFGFSGIYDEDDAEKIRGDQARDVTPPRSAPKPPAAPQTALTPPKPPAQPSPHAEIVQDVGTDWPLELESYRNRLGECETEDSLAEAIESYGPVFDDAPADVQSKVCAAESDRRSNIVDRTEDDRTPTDPREAVLHELRSVITNGEKRVSFLLQDLSAERRALVTEDDRKALVAMQKGIEADRNGSAGK